MEFTAVLTPAEEGGYIALNPETDTTVHIAQVLVKILRQRSTTLACGWEEEGLRHPILIQAGIWNPARTPHHEPITEARAVWRGVDRCIEHHHGSRALRLGDGVFAGHEATP